MKYKVIWDISVIVNGTVRNNDKEYSQTKIIEASNFRSAKSKATRLMRNDLRMQEFKRWGSWSDEQKGFENPNITYFYRRAETVYKYDYSDLKEKSYYPSSSHWIAHLYVLTKND